MVRIALAILAFIPAILAGPVARDVPTIEADINSISTQVTNLDNSIKSFPDSGGSVAQALAIDTASSNLVTSLDQGTSDVNANGPIDETDGQTIFSLVEGFAPTILDALSAIVDKKTALGNVGLGTSVFAIVLSDLQSLNSSTSAFQEALFVTAPPDLQGPAAELSSQIGAAFATAIAAYS